MAGDSEHPAAGASHPERPPGVWAHSANAAGQWHDLREHLEAVAALANRFAAPFGAGAWAELAGLWHDLGKYLPEFQAMLSAVESDHRKQRVDHSSVGAVHAAALIREALGALPDPEAAEFAQVLLVATIAGHHGGLPDTPAALTARVADRQTLLMRAMEQAPPREILHRRFPFPPRWVFAAKGRDRRLRCEFLARMIFSTLVDADRLDTAASRERGLPVGEGDSQLRGAYTGISELRAAVDRAIDMKVAALDPARMGPLEGHVFRYRQAVLDACRKAAETHPGAFSLDVATGGGKTLASLSFGLRHAERHGKSRVIVVIPYTSIIEQSAAAYRAALGAALAFNLLEHHSAVEGSDDEARYDRDAVRQRLAAENWDAPLIVTTGVQFFESLFARSPSRCRKLHNIANAVIVLDEAQTLPPELLNPTVWAINELVEGYGCSVVLSTATQPALEAPFPEVRNLRPVVPTTVDRPPERVRVEVVSPTTTEWGDLARALASPANERSLCITHRRDDARELTLALDAALGTDYAIHLSGTMCAAHRGERLDQIRGLLKAQAPCRVVSTQLVEAGVDLDFPVVYRVLAGLDSLVQAAGRANREGKLGEHGGVLRVFRAPTAPPPGLPRIGAGIADSMFRSAAMDGAEVPLFDPATAREFFHRYYRSIADKDRGITPMRAEFRFGDVEKAYRFIDDGGVTLIVPLDECARHSIHEARSAGSPGRALRRLQRYTVTVYPRQIRLLLDDQAAEPVFKGEDPAACSLFLLTRPALYHARFGLDLSRLGYLGPEETIV